MTAEKFWKFVRIVLYVVIIVLVIYSLFAAWSFYKGLKSDNLDGIVSHCNNLAKVDRINDFCCEKRSFIYEGESYSLSCSEIYEKNFSDEVVDFDCTEMNCS